MSYNKNIGVITQEVITAPPGISLGLDLDFDITDPASYPGSGATLTDLTGNHNASMSALPAFSNVAGVSKLTFTGLQTIYPTGSWSATDWSVGYWIKYTASNRQYQRLWGMSGYRLELVIHSDRMHIYDGGWRNTGVYLTPNTEWHRIDFVYTNSPRNFKLYKDGLQVYTGTIGRTMSGTFRIFGSSDNRRPRADFSRIQAYKRTLSPTEILQNYEHKKAYYGR